MDADKSKRAHEETYTTRSCRSCPNLDTNEMVQCDLCDSWYHYQCVNVTSEIEHQPWVCGNCTLMGAVANQPIDNDPPLEVPSGVVSKDQIDPEKASSMASRHSSRKSLSARQRLHALMKLEEEQFIRLDVLERKYRIIAGSEVEADSVSCLSERVSKTSSLEAVSKWAKDVHDISKNFSRISLSVDSPIPSSDHGKVNQLTSEHLKKALSAAEATIQNKNILKPAVLSSKTAESPSFRPTLNFPTNVPDQSHQSIGLHSTKAVPAPSDKSFRGIFGAFGHSGVEHTSRNIQSAPKMDDFSSKIKGDRLKQPNFESNDGDAFGIQFSLPKLERNLQGREKTVKSDFSTFDQSNFWRSGYGTNTYTQAPSKANTGVDWNNFQVPLTHQNPTSNPSVASNYQNVGASTTMSGGMPSSNFFGIPMPTTSNVQNPVQRSNFGVHLSGYISNPTGQLTSNQIAARHVFRELPEFYGKPEEWPLYLSALKTSTETCGYTDGENLLQSSYGIIN